MRARRLAVACVLLMSVASGASVAQAQEGGVNFVAEPVPGSQTAPGGGYFLLSAEPGTQVEQAIGLRNDSAGPLQIELAAVDAVTGQLGGASYALASEDPEATGAWITLERTSVTLAPDASAVVPFQVAVPPDANSGHHLAGISINVPKTQSAPGEAGEGQAGASIDVQTRRIIAVQVNLPGPADPELVVNGVAPVARPDGLYLEIAIANTGRGLTKATGVVAVGDDFEQEFDVDTFVPGTSIGYPVKWIDAEDGEYPARVELRYGDQTEQWEGTVTVGDEVLEELADRQVEPTGAPSDGGSDLPVAALMAAAVVGAVLVGGGGLAVSRLRRLRGRHSGSP